MIPDLEPHELPRWLAEFQPGEDSGRLPIRSLLENSLYYAACGRDGDPVRFLGGFLHSFVFVDYATGRDEVFTSLRDHHRGFRCYRIFPFRRPIDTVSPLGHL